MKTIIKKENNVSFFIMEDTTKIEITEKNIKFDEIVIIDMNSNNSIIIENVLPIPEDWVSGKYKYILEDPIMKLKPWGWILNSEWVEPKKEDEV